MSVILTPQFRPQTEGSTEENMASVQEMYDDSVEGLTNKCDKYVSILRNTVVSLGTLLREKKINPSQFQDLFAFPIANLELGRDKLEWVQKKVREKYRKDVQKLDKEEGYFCNTYLKVSDLKSWGYRFIDYASASVALAMIFIEASKAQDTTQDSSRLTSHWGVTGGLLVLSKVLSAATDYRNKKLNEKAILKAKLLDLKYRCDKIYEAAALIDLLKAMTRSVSEIDPIALKCQLKRSIRALKEEGANIVPRSIAKDLKKGLSDLLEEKIFQEAGSAALLNFHSEKRNLKRIFDAWNRQRFAVDSETSVEESQSLDEGGCAHIIDEHQDSAGGIMQMQDQNILTIVDVGGMTEHKELENVGIGQPDTSQNFNLTANLQYGTGYSTQLSTGSSAQQSFGWNTPRDQTTSFILPPNLLQQHQRAKDLNLC